MRPVTSGMRVIAALLLLLLAPAAAMARPLDDDRSFARDGILLRDEPDGAYAVVALADGGSLYAYYHGLLRLSRAGREVQAPPLVPPGIPHTLVPGLAVGVRTPLGEFGKPSPLSVWRLAPDGTTLAHHDLAVPARAVSVMQAVPRGDGFALLLRISKPGAYTGTLHVAALTGDGELDTSWGDGGLHPITEKTATIGGGRDGSVVIAGDLTIRCLHRKVRPTLRVERLGPDGDSARARTHVLGPKKECTTATPGEIDVDRARRITISTGTKTGGSLIRLRPDLRRDRRFGRGGVVRYTSKPTWWRTVELARRPGGGFAIGYTTSNSNDVPRANAALVDRRGRLVRARRLRVMRRYPASDLSDIAFDRAGRILVAGMLRDTNHYIREDYGEPHLAVWRLRGR